MRKGIESFAELVGRVQASGARTETLATNWAGQTQIVARIGDPGGPPVVLLAGAHGPEFHGVNAALRLIENLKTSCDLYVVPAVDPLGVESLSSALGFALDDETRVETHDGARSVLRERAEVLVDEGTFLIARTDAAAFIVSDPGPMDFLRQCLPGHGYEGVISATGQLLVGQPQLKDALRGRRIITPSNFFFEGIGPLEHLYQCLQIDAWSVYPGFKDLASTYPFPDPPVEVAAIKQLMADVKPALFLDLHGGYGTKCYFYTSFLEAGDEKRRAAGCVMTDAVQQAGFPVNETADELRPITRNWDSRFALVAPGLAMHFYPWRHELAVSYFERYSLTYMLEPALSNPYEDAVSMHCIAAGAAIRWLEEGFKRASSPELDGPATHEEIRDRATA